MRPPEFSISYIWSFTSRLFPKSILFRKQIWNTFHMSFNCYSHRWLKWLRLLEVAPQNHLRGCDSPALEKIRVSKCSGTVRLSLPIWTGCQKDRPVVFFKSYEEQPPAKANSRLVSSRGITKCNLKYGLKCGKNMAIHYKDFVIIFASCLCKKNQNKKQKKLHS